MAKCPAGSCRAGMIGPRQIEQKDWADELARFQDGIELWNLLTRRFAIPHPGFANPFIFCPVCGHKIEALNDKQD